MKKRLTYILLFKDDHGLGHLPFFSYLCGILGSEHRVFVLLYSQISHKHFPSSQIIELPEKLRYSSTNIERMDYLEKTVIEIKPDIFLVDYFPFGRFENIFDIEIIARVVHKNDGMCFTFMRDFFYGTKLLGETQYDNFLKKIIPKDSISVSDYIWKNIKIIHKLVHTYKMNDIFFIQLYIDFVFDRGWIDGILVFGDKNIFDIRDEFLLGEENKKKWHHLGYLSHDKKDSIEKITCSKKKILVSSGGNISSRKDFISLLQFLVTQDGFDIQVLVGPYVDEYIQREIEGCLHGVEHIYLLPFQDDFSKLLHESDYFFGFGGYGTFMDLFQYEGKAYIMANYNLSNFRHRYYEQKYRAKLFESILNVEFLDDFSQSHLETCVNDVQKKSVNLGTIHFSDAQSLQNRLSQLYNSHL